MKPGFVKTGTVLVLALLLLPAGAMAALNTITQGNMVFLGEQGLDITAAMGSDTQIAWWASAAEISGSAPTYTMDVGPTSSHFFVDPGLFTGKLGPWYRLNAAGQADGVAFVVTDPTLDMRIWDATVGVDATSNGWITSDDAVEFRITTNLYQMGQRPGVSGAPITIKVQSPDGATFSALVSPSGATTGIVEMPVSTSPYSTGAIWDTSRKDLYPPGTYRIWAECNANSMKDNYEMPGRTYTPSSGILNQEQNPLIVSGGGQTTAATTVATSAPTTVATTVATTVPTTVTTAPTTIPATVLTSLPATPGTVPPTATTAKSPGFEAVLAGAALLLGLAWIARKD
jgi:Domain of unknown function (DUF3821)